MVTTRSAVRAASLGSPVVWRTVPPWAACARSSPYSQLFSRGDSPSARLVQDQGVRVSQQRGGEPEPTVHPHRQSPQALVPEPGEADDLQHLVGPGGGYARGRAEHPELPPDGPGGVAGHVAQEHAHLPCRVGDAVQWPPPEIGDAPPGVQFEHQPQGRGPARAGSAQQGRDPSGRGLEGQIVHGGGPVATGGAGESDGLEHRFSRVSRGR
ncbi:hypothetical protein SBADM41S_07967 [Streptomyces badius]